MNTKVCSLIDNPDLLSPDVRSTVLQLYPSDAIDRAQSLLSDMGGSSGSYSHTQGIPVIREHVAEFIKGKYLI
jgi:alanine transaminase